MLPVEPPETAEAAAAAINRLSDAAWVLAALVRALGGDGTDDVAARVLLAAGLFREDGAALSPTPGLVALVERSNGSIVDAIRSALNQVATVTRGVSPEHTWARQDDETLFAQGAASGGLVRPLLPVLFARLPRLEERLTEPGARFLDVGVGVGGLACAFAEAIPSLSIVGIDPFPRALRLASQLVAARGLEGRVSLRGCGVEDVTDHEVFDLAWLPAPFVPPPAFARGIANLFRALRAGGWILVGMGRLEGVTVSTAVTRWQTALNGGTPMTPAEAAERLRAVGFTDVVTVDTPPAAPVLVAARRPD